MIEQKELPLSFNGFVIKEMTDVQLKEAAAKVIAMSKFRSEQLKAQKDRHKNFDLENENPAFLKVVTAIDDELKARNL